MTIDMYTTEKGGKTTIPHDLNFAKPTYENVHKVTFRNPSMALQGILRETGPIPTDEERKKTKTDGGIKNKKKVYDVEKMADALPQCEEDDLLQIIQMIHDGKTDNSFVSNNIDGKEALSGRPMYRIPTLQEELEMSGEDMIGTEHLGIPSIPLLSVCANIRYSCGRVIKHCVILLCRDCVLTCLVS